MDEDRRLLVYAELSLLMEIHLSGNEWQEVISEFYVLFYLLRELSSHFLLSLTKSQLCLGLGFII
jgi:hypothetical protein